MKSLLILIDSLGPGGAEKVLYTFLQHWNKEKYEITVVPIVDKGVYSSKIKAIKGIKTLPIIHNRSSFLGLLFNKLIYKLVYTYLPSTIVYKLFIPKNHDIEIAFCEGFTTQLLSKSTNQKSRKIAWIHTDLVNNNWPLRNGIFKNLEEEKTAYTKFDIIIGVSNIVCKGFDLLFSLSNIRCIYNPIGNNKALFLNIKNKDKIEGQYKLISIGRLVYEKGFDILIDAVGNLLQEGINIDLTILGEGPLRKTLEKKVEASNITNYVHLVGFKDNPYYYLGKADIYVSSSRYEGFSLAIAEAMNAGLPIVATKCAGPMELLDNGNYGIMVDCSTEGLAEGLKKIIKNQKLQDYYAEKALIRSKIFSVGDSLLLTEKILDE